MKKILLTIAALLLIAGCSSNDVNFSIDNPTTAVLKLQIDNTFYEIPAKQAKDIVLKAGEHRLDAPATGKLGFIVYAERKGALINPTLSDYVIVSESYTINEEKRKNFRPAGGGPFQLDGVTFNGPFTLANTLFIEKDWRFGVREVFPDTLKGYDPGNGGNIFRKIFTAPDFISYFEAGTEQAGFFEKNRKHLSPAPRKVSPPPALPIFADPQIQNASLKLRDLYSRYLHATDPAQQKQLQSEHFKLSVEFVTFVAPRLGTQGQEENLKHSEFVTLIGNALGKSAQVKAA